MSARRVGAAVVIVGFVAGCAVDREEQGSATDAADDATVAQVTLTWLSVTNWLLEAGNTRVLLDGYVSRVDRTTVAQDGSSTEPAPLDTAAVRAVRDAVLPDGDLDWVLVGHGHWDHAFDTPAWAKLTGARIAGARSVCMHAVALGVAEAGCTAVEGGELIELGPGVTARAVRWHHSGDSTSVNGRRLRAPLELRSVPTPDPATGGLRPGYLEDYPNGGGARAWLITVAGSGDRPIRLLWSNTGNPQAWDAPVPADSAFFREQGIPTAHLEWAVSEVPTRDHLRQALTAERADTVDLWIGFGGTEHVRQVTAELHPRTFVPHHWDDFWIPLADGPANTFDDSGIAPVLDSAGIRLLVPTRYFERVTLGAQGISLRPPR